MRRLPALVFYLLAAVPQTAFSQQTAGGNVTPVLLPGLGNRHHPISTKSPEAQKYFDQGLALVFGFNRAEAVRSFRRAAQLDPEAAMPHWGMALAYGRHMNMDTDLDVESAKAYAAVQDTIALSGRASEKEQLSNFISKISEIRPEQLRWLQASDPIAQTEWNWLCRQQSIKADRSDIHGESTN